MRKTMLPLTLAYLSLVDNSYAIKKQDNKTYVTYPSGLKLKVVTNPNDKTCPLSYFRDTNNSGNRLVRVRTSDLDKKVSEHFKVKDFSYIEDPQYVPNRYKHQLDGKNYFKCMRLNPFLVTKLEKARRKTGALYTDEGYRPPSYNKQTGGVPRSRHVSGDAVDLRYTANKKTKRKIDSIFNQGGLGTGPTTTHLDIRRKRARWHY